MAADLSARTTGWPRVADPAELVDAAALERALWRRSARTGALLAGGAITIVGVYLLATPAGPNRPSMWATAGIAAAVALGLLLMPWGRLIERRLARTVIAGWLVVMGAAIAVGCLLDGGFASPLQALFSLPFLYGATHLPPATVRRVGAAIGVMILGTGLLTGTASVAGAVVLLGAPGLLLVVSTMIAATFQRQTKALQRQAAQLDELARVDSLTGCLNHRSFHEQLERVLASGEPGAPIAVALLDVDHFKQVNDEHGHPTGDEVLRLVGRALRSAVREDDPVARTGGEEFAIILAPTGEGGGREIVDGILARARTAVTDATRAFGVPVTVSVGLAFSDAAAGSAEALLRRADEALYRAKRAGRDQLVVADAAPPPPP